MLVEDGHELFEDAEVEGWCEDFALVEPYVVCAEEGHRLKRFQKLNLQYLVNNPLPSQGCTKL